MTECICDEKHGIICHYHENKRYELAMKTILDLFFDSYWVSSGDLKYLKIGNYEIKKVK